jgi:hypothetical protein
MMVLGERQRPNSSPICDLDCETTSCLFRSSAVTLPSSPALQEAWLDRV